MRIGTLSLLAVAALISLALVAGCGGDNNHPQPPGDTGTVTGELYGAVGGQFSPLGNQTVAINGHSAQTQADTGRFTITDVSPGNFVIAVNADPAFGEVLNPQRLHGTVGAGGSQDVGRILLGLRPPPP